MNRVEWTPGAARQLRKLPKPAQVDIRNAVQEKLPHFPQCSGIKALVNHPSGYRLRVGNYRVRFDFEGSIKLIRIEEIGKRDEGTYWHPDHQGRRRATGVRRDAVCRVHATHRP